MADKTTIGLAGEFYVLAQLAHRGLVGTMTLSNTKGVDILVSNPEMSTLHKLEVKTSQKRPGRERLFGDGQFYRWAMGKKHESIRDSRLFYCFVYLAGPGERPQYFVVPSGYVADYVRDEHQRWRDSRKHEVAETTMRVFRIPIDDPDGFEDNWDALGTENGAAE